MASIEAQHRRRGRASSETDMATRLELKARAWAWGEVTHQRAWILPSWADRLIPPRRAGGYGRFLAVLLAAHRAGACGVLLGYHEILALCQITSRATWTRWWREMEAIGLIRKVQTWRVDPTGAAPHCLAKILYRIGPALEDAAGGGLLERAGNARKAWAARMAAGARRQARAERDERRERHFEQNKRTPRYCNTVQYSSPNSEHSPPVRGADQTQPPPGAGMASSVRPSGRGISGTPPAAALQTTESSGRAPKPPGQGFEEGANFVPPDTLEARGARLAAIEDCRGALDRFGVRRRLR